MEIVDYKPDESLQAYRVKVTIRNNLLLTAIEEAGYKSVASFAREIGHTHQELNSFVSLRKAPINANGEFCPLAKHVMEALGAAPSDLWTTEQLTMRLPRNTVENILHPGYWLDTKAMQSVLGGNILKLEGATYEDIETPEQIQTKKELAERMASNLDSLTPRQAKVLRLRYGIGGSPEHTLEDIGELFGIGKERIRQIEAKALRKLREASKMKQCEDFLKED